MGGFPQADDPFGTRRGRRRDPGDGGGPPGTARGGLAGAARATGRVLRAVLRWRSWRLPVKLTAVTLIPVVLAITVSALAIDSHVQRAQRYAAVEQRVAAGQRVRAVIAAAQRERNFAAVAAAPDRPGTQAKRKAEQPLDFSVAAARAAMAGLPGDDPIVAARWADARYQLGRLGGLRTRWQAGTDATIAGYSDLIGSLLALDRALAGSGGDAAIARSASTLYALDGVTEQVFHEQALVLAGITRGHMRADEVAAIRDAEATRVAKIADFRSLASSDEQRAYETTMSGPAINRRQTYLRTAIENAPVRRSTGNADNRQEATRLASSQRAGTVPLRLSASDWNSSSDATTGKLHGLTDRMARDLRAHATSLRDAASDGAITAAAVLLVALLLASAIVWIIARQLARSIRTLHRSARQVADRDIPTVVADIQGGAPVRKTIDPVPVSGDDEVGQLARAFDAVHSAARRLAVEQAGLRSSYGAVFVNLSRRSQSLVQRQLRLLERLERDEEDPQQLSTLFQLDHLATRMRRNNENLMVLSGSGQGNSRAQAPTTTGDLLRAAVSEIEQYQRVTLHVPPAVQVVGYAAGDLVRLLAELLDNATAYSSPDTQVTVSTHQQGDGALVVDIVDEGIGMREEELDQANRNLAGTSATELPATRRMGLFVVARLADAHGVDVRLHGGDGIGGLRASVTVPADLVLGLAAPAPRVATEAPPESDLETTLAASTFAAMPALPGWTGTALSEPLPFAEPPGGRGGTGERATPHENATNLGASGISAAALFAAQQPTSPRERPQAPARTGSEKTPIFDEMVSAWFDPDAGGPEAQGSPFRPSGSADDDAARWRFDADSGWRAARHVADGEAERTTTAGLPRRTPKARLVPGSAGGDGAVAGAVARDPQRVHDRLASFQDGLASGRHAAADSPASPGQDSGPEMPDELPSVDGGAATANPGAEPPAGRPDAATHRSGLPQRSPAAAPTEPAVMPDEPADVPADPGMFAADDGWQALARAADAAEAAAVATPGVPAGPAGSGLPRRSPRAHLVPGSVGGTGSAGTGSVSRDAAGVRDRLASFQRGVREGRGDAVPGGPADAADRHGTDGP